MKEHELKTDPQVFDLLEYVHPPLHVRVTYILRGPIMGLRRGG